MKKTIRVLVAEDDYLVCEMIKGLLDEMEGYEVAGEAATGLEAIELTKSLNPDVVLLDIRMPDLDGIEATRQISATCPTPIVILSAYETPELVEMASEAGAGSYLVKPPNIRDLERAFITTIARFSDMITLRQLNRELQERVEELDAFGYTVAHDLQNPLTLLIGYAEALRRYYETMSEQEIMQCLVSIEQTGRKMSRIVDQLLLLARAHEVNVDLEPLRMGRILVEVQKFLEHMVAQYGAVINVPDKWPVAVGYAPWVEEVWYNYISNAIKYGDSENPIVELGADELPDGMIKFWVRDNGRGLGLEEQDRLFTPFTRLDWSGTKGHGLGLSIVRRIVQRLGGQADVESQIGAGSTFFFTLPAASR